MPEVNTSSAEGLPSVHQLVILALRFDMRSIRPYNPTNICSRF
jgi:hypothetical protein